MWVIDTFEKAKETCLVLLELDVLMVLDSGDASDHFAALASEEILHLSMPMKGMLAGIEQFFEVEEERGDPNRIVSIDAPGKMKKLLKVAASEDGSDDYIRYHASDPMTGTAYPTLTLLQDDERFPLPLWEKGEGIVLMNALTLPLVASCLGRKDQERNQSVGQYASP